MRNDTQTLIAVVRRYVNLWRRREGWSIGTVGAWIIAAHENNGWDKLTGLRFEPNTTDAFDRQRINGERIARWLDDETKDSNLLPSNFLPSTLLALPPDLRISCIDEILSPLGMSARLISDDANESRLADLICGVAKEDGEATTALAKLLDGASPEELQTAQRELTESLTTTQQALAWVESKLNLSPPK